jgi:hypothetical protein
MIACGHCKEKHETVDQVRECSEAKRAGKTTYLTLPQQKYLGDLLGHFGLELEGDVDTNTIPYKNGQAILSALIDARRQQATSKSFTLPAGTRLLPHPKKGKPRERRPTLNIYKLNIPDVPEGHYAIPSRTGNNDYEFFRVDRPTTGDFAGRIYVKMVIGGHPEYNVRGGLKSIIVVLNAIMEYGVDKAGLLYGHELKQCRYCNRELTKYASRILSAGRHCCDKRGRAAEWDAVQLLRSEGEE